MTRGQNQAGVWQRYEFDAAGRMKRVTDDAGNWLQDYGYGASREKIFQNSQGVLTWYVWGGDVVISEYTAASWGGGYTWAKSYVYAGSRLLSTFAANGTGGETLEFHHPDRLGTRMVTNPSADTLYLQSTLPFGTAFASETTGSSTRLFTSYDRSPSTGLDYAVNRTYSPGQGRFTTVDPIGMASVSPADPQSLNQFAYTRNSPTDFVDPSGLVLSVCYGYDSFYDKFENGVYVGTDYRGFTAQICIVLGGGGGSPGGGHTGGDSGDVSEGPTDGQEAPPPQQQQDACNYWLKSYYPQLKPYFDKLWDKTQKSKSAEAPNGLEAGGIISINDSRVSLGGIEETGLEPYNGKTYKDGMGEEFDKWQLEQKRLMHLADPGLTLLVVHTHPDGDGTPSGPGDYEKAKNHPEAVVGANEISVYQKGKGILCTIKR